VHCETCDAQFVVSQAPHSVAVLVPEHCEAHLVWAHVSSTRASRALAGASAVSHVQVHDVLLADEKQPALHVRSASHEPVPDGTPAPLEQFVAALCSKAQSARALQSVPALAAHAMKTLLARQSVAQLVG
jgi:hypothetical protein